MKFKLVDFDPDNKPQKGNEVKVEFKIGDRIRIKQNCTWTNVYGKTGTVYATNSPLYKGVLVKVDDFSDGHNGELYLESLGRKPESEVDTSKWILSESDLYKIENDGQNENGKGRAKEVQFKIGDRVKVTQNDENCGQKGTIVDVCDFYYDNLYLIRFDDQKRGHSGSFFYVAARREDPRPAAKTGYWMLREHGMMPVCDGEDEKNGAKKPARRIVVIEINDDGAKARYFNGGKIPAKEAKVKRYHSDEPDDGIAAMYAIGKLFGRNKKEKDLDGIAKLKDALVEAGMSAATVCERVEEAFHKLRQIMK